MSNRHIPTLADFWTAYTRVQKFHAGHVLSEDDAEALARVLVMLRAAVSKAVATASARPEAAPAAVAETGTEVRQPD
jgi:hypothetical protein